EIRAQRARIQFATVRPPEERQGRADKYYAGCSLFPPWNDHQPHFLYENGREQVSFMKDARHQANARRRIADGSTFRRRHHNNRPLRFGHITLQPASIWQRRRFVMVFDSWKYFDAWRQAFDVEGHIVFKSLFAIDSNCHRMARTRFQVDMV